MARKRKKKRTGLRVFILLLVLALIYVAYSFFMTLQVHRIVQSSLESHGENYTAHSRHVASEELYQRLGFSREKDMADEYQFSITPAIHWFIGGMVNCDYSYVAYDEAGDVVKGTEDQKVKISIGLKDFLWCIQSIEPVPKTT